MINTEGREPGDKTRKPGYYWVCWHHSTQWFPAQWTGIKWSVGDEYGHMDFYKDAHFDFIDDNRITRTASTGETELIESQSSVWADLFIEWRKLSGHSNSHIIIRELSKKFTIARKPEPNT